ncbi:MAG: tetratricopeptide repeat protein [Spirochaetota bacterium]
MRYIGALIIALVMPAALCADEIDDARKLLAAGKTNEASIAMRRFLVRNPVDVRRADAAFILAETEQEYFPAILAYRSVYDGYPDYARRDEVSYRIGVLYRLHGNHTEASRWFTVTASFTNSSYRTRSLLASAAAETARESYDTALAAYEAIVREYEGVRDAAYYEAAAGMGHALFGQSRFDRAREKYLEVVRANAPIADRPFVIYRIALCHENMGELDRAAEEYRSVVSGYPSSYAATLARQRIKQLPAQKAAVPTNTASVKETATNIPATNAAVQSTNVPQRPYATYQTGLFQKEASAVTLRDFIRSMGYAAYIVKDTKNNAEIFRVRIDVPDERAMNAMKGSLTRENIPFFKTGK